MFIKYSKPALYLCKSTQILEAEPKPLIYLALDFQFLAQFLEQQNLRNKKTWSKYVGNATPHVLLHQVLVNWHKEVVRNKDLTYAVYDYIRLLSIFWTVS